MAVAHVAIGVVDAVAGIAAAGATVVAVAAADGGGGTGGTGSVRGCGWIMGVVDTACTTSIVVGHWTAMVGGDGSLVVDDRNISSGTVSGYICGSPVLLISRVKLG